MPLRPTPSETLTDVPQQPDPMRYQKALAHLRIVLDVTRGIHLTRCIHPCVCVKEARAFLDREVGTKTGDSDPPEISEPETEEYP